MQKVTVYGENGEVAEVSQMDAAEYVASGYYSYKPKQSEVVSTEEKPKRRTSRQSDKPSE